ncbi:MAG TPA: hypothetical protein VEC60_17370 [Reyranella sp.]|nr:hypothetical protein [Reyranella sp.]
MTIELKLRPSHVIGAQVIGVALRVGDRTYSQRFPTTHAALVEAVKANTAASFWHDLGKAEFGLMMDDGAFVPGDPQ